MNEMMNGANIHIGMKAARGIGPTVGGCLITTVSAAGAEPVVERVTNAVICDGRIVMAWRIWFKILRSKVFVNKREI